MQPVLLTSRRAAFRPITRTSCSQWLEAGRRSRWYCLLITAGLDRTHLAISFAFDSPFSMAEPIKVNVNQITYSLGDSTRFFKEIIETTTTQDLFCPKWKIFLLQHAAKPQFLIQFQTHYWHSATSLKLVTS